MVVDPADLELGPTLEARLAAAPDRTRDRNLEILREYAGRPPTGAPRRIVLHFLVSPVEIIGSERVEALVVVHNELYESEDGSLRPQPTGRRTHPAGGAGLPRDRLPGGAAARGSPSTRWRA